MSVYIAKVLELLSVETKLNQSYLKLRLLAEEDVDLLCHIDDMTAANLKKILDDGKVFKYRLSLSSSWDPTKKRYESFVTKTYLQTSERIYFECSADYADKLNAVKVEGMVPQIEDIEDAPNNFTPPDATVEQAIIKTKSSKLSYLLIASLASILFTFVLGFSYIFNLPPTEPTKVKAEKVPLVDSTTVVKENIEPSKKEPVAEVVKDEQFELPSLDLNESISYSLPNGKVAITFDDGPSHYTKEITDILKSHQVGATFFFVGRNVVKYPDVVQYVNSNGYSIGNHSTNHSNLAKLSFEDQHYEIIHTNDVIEEVTQEKVVLFRPPYGSKNDMTLDIINEANGKVVLWNSDPEDWKTRNANDIFDYVMNTKASGSIILLHESQATIDALPQIIEYLKGLDLEIVNLN